MITPDFQPLIFVVSAPSGAGKTTLCNKLLCEFNRIAYSVSCTTRKPRPAEEDGSSYHFLSEEEFKLRAEAGAFLEHARVHGHAYGTLRETVEGALRDQRDVLMDLDVQGARQIRDTLASLPNDDILRKAHVDIFIAPPSIEDLHCRLLERAQDDEEVIRKRLLKAEEELSHWNEYQYLVVNDEVDDAYNLLRSIYLSEHARVRC